MDDCAGERFAAGTGGAGLCEPLARLKREHGPLRRLMDEMATVADEVAASDEAGHWRLTLLNLAMKAEVFAGRLEPHSEREESVLFPLLGQYIGRTAGPITVMEYEHDQAKESLAVFLDGVGSLDITVIALHEAKELAAHICRAHEILTGHFGKEENVLFPMAERLLTEDDKAQLALAFDNIA